MHYHKYDVGKGTYRFFRDNRNTGEYNTVMDTINAAVWLSEFHLKFGELNQQISSCLMDKANQMDSELTAGNKNFSNDEFRKLLGREPLTFPETLEGGHPSLLKPS